MIADTAVLGSPWNTDTILLHDHNFGVGLSSSPDSKQSDLDALLESCLSDGRPKSAGGSTSRHNTSTGTSVASSDCSDEYDLYLENDMDENLFGDISSTIMNSIQESDVSDSTAILNTLDWYTNMSDTESFDFSNSSESDNTPVKQNKSLSLSMETASATSPSSSSTHRCRNSIWQDAKKWNLLKHKERLALVEELSRIVSSELGLREQLEVIRIINPSATVSPTDTEFVIELDSLNERKLQQIQECISLNGCSKCSTSTCKGEQNFVSNKKLQKKLKTQERRSRQTAIRQRHRKDYRQMLKEKRSGLFVREEVLLLSVDHDHGVIEEDDSDIDILQ